MARRIGIDLGTTNSVAAIWYKDKPVVVESREGKRETSSVVSLRKTKHGVGEVLVGDIALANAVAASKDTIISVKRLMDRGSDDPEVAEVKRRFPYKIVAPERGTSEGIRVVLGGKEYSPVDISALILKKIKDDAEHMLGEEVTHAVITVPAYFTQGQIAATKQAAEKAGLVVLDILDEPTAAAIALGMDNDQGGDTKYILVYDLGGGTFDVSLLMWSDNVFTTLVKEGDMWLGGDNFDELIMDYIVEQIQEEQFDPRTNGRLMAKLRQAARAAKDGLTSSRSYPVIIPEAFKDEAGDGVDVNEEISREWFEKKASALVQKADYLVEKALTSQHLSSEDIHHVILSGNATRIPLVEKSVIARFGREKILPNNDRKHCVAIGANHVASRIRIENKPELPPPPPPEIDDGPILVTKTTAWAYAAKRRDGDYHVYVRKGDVCPTLPKKRDDVGTFKANEGQRLFCIPIFRAEAARNFDNGGKMEKEGELLGVLPKKLKSGDPIMVKLWITEEERFTAEASLASGDPVILCISRGEEINRAFAMVEQALEKYYGLDPMRRVDFTERLEAIYERLDEGKYQEAMELCQDMIDAINKGGDGPVTADNICEMAERAADFNDSLIQGLGMALPPQSHLILTGCTAKLRAALASGNPLFCAQALAEDQRATNDDPPLNFLVNRFCKSASTTQMLKQAGHEQDIEQQGVEEGLREAIALFAHRTMGEAEAKMDDTDDKIAIVMRRAFPEAICNHKGCGLPTNGRRYCPKGHDNWGTN